MMRTLLFSCLLLAGCQPTSAPVEETGPDDTAAPTILLGHWTTSTMPESKDSRTTMVFLKTGEFKFNAPLIISGKPVVAEFDGKSVAARLIVNGDWTREGNRITVAVTQTNQPSITIQGPWEYEIISNTADKLVLHGQGEDGKRMALFRDNTASDSSNAP